MRINITKQNKNTPRGPQTNHKWARADEKVQLKNGQPNDKYPL